MRRRTLAILTALAASGLLAAGIAPATAADDPPDGAAYVALGDSIAAGTGNLPYVDTDCMQSRKAYPQLFARAFGIDVASSACSGATTADVLTEQLSHLGSDTQLVTITAGINNLGWTTLLQECAQDESSLACQAATGGAFAALAALPDDIGLMVATVRQHAPNAHIAVTGYPMLFGQVATPCSIGAFERTPVKVTAAQAQFINVAVMQVNGAIAAGLAGYALEYSQMTGIDANVSFVPLTGTFAGHGLCDTGDRWISGFVNGAPVAARSLHPNSAGQRAIAELLVEALG
ncbi:GDSL-like Lipase/Acylhydrolase family protein [Agrococcus baldri]|uniref:GDSL-like Lipase/Acylhydrolase family protein n=1 Tax=Agrococcus baldri TaxID=153730 RepID=A0AA94HK69_9MICO|nr:SGNH/GDSL hydrolase family protein [Agrococcus baldri]SFR98527.1 GDSL-like Lipase/Acylhydrolase family protein [Agrococcus baldri]